MTIISVVSCLLLFVLLITWLKLNPFLAFLVTSIVAGIVLGIPVENIPAVIEKGIGGMLGSLVILILLSAMFGKLVSDSGAAQRIAESLMGIFGTRYMKWAMMLTGFIVGIPIFYNVGFVLLVPLVFSVSFRYKLPVVPIGISMLAALSVTHGYLPPHPSPSAIVPMFGANMGKTLVYGILVAVPSMALAGPIFSGTLKKITANPLEIFKPKELEADKLPGTFNSFFTALLPVVLIAFSTIIPTVVDKESKLYSILSFFSNPGIVMLVALAFGSISLGISSKMKLTELMSTYSAAIKDIATILFIIAGAGALKQVFVESGVSEQIAEMLKGLHINLLLLAWIIATVIRICVGSATVAGLTAAGILAPVVANSGVDPNLMVLAIGAGSLMFSHVNDSGFWMYKEYFNLSLKDTFRSWTLMETIVGITGIIIILIIDQFVKF
ncbi:MAG: gluconate:H+ symporter [Bacteroidales bacterium]